MPNPTIFGFSSAEWATIVVALITSGIFTGLIEFVKFLITRNDNKKDKKDEEILRLQAQIVQVQQQTNEQLALIKDALIGMGYMEIKSNCKQWMDKGSIPIDEFNDLKNQLYKPYRGLGGNGDGETLFEEVERLNKTTE